MEQKPVAEDMLYITVRDFTKEEKVLWKKTLSSEKDNIMFCILCLAKMTAVKLLAEAVKLAKLADKRQSASSGKAGYHRDNS